MLGWHRLFFFWFLNKNFPCSSSSTTPKDFDRCVPNVFIRDHSDGNRAHWRQQYKRNSVIGSSWKIFNTEHNREVEPVNSHGPKDLEQLQMTARAMLKCCKGVDQTMVSYFAAKNRRIRCRVTCDAGPLTLIDIAQPFFRAFDVLDMGVYSQRLSF
jgi:hypothetical protein